MNAQLCGLVVMWRSRGGHVEVTRWPCSRVVMWSRGGHVVVMWSRVGHVVVTWSRDLPIRLIGQFTP